MDTYLETANLVRDVDKEIICNRMDFLYSRPQRMEIDSRTCVILSSFKSEFIPTQSVGSMPDYSEYLLEKELAAWDAASDDDFKNFEASL